MNRKVEKFIWGTEKLFFLAALNPHEEKKEPSAEILETPKLQL